jgi:hypothetical protein
VIQLDLHRLDTAEQFATSVVRTYGEGHRRDRIWAEFLKPRHMCDRENPGA